MTNRTLAKKIIEQKAKITPIGDGWHYDLRDVIGDDRSFYKYGKLPKGAMKGAQPPTVKIDRATADKMAVDWIAESLDEGNLVLSDTWAKDHLDK